ncbi:MAG: DNA polymerase III subunit delta [Oscillospiraceae bacterium]|nr:DNA polymerase III subunit delta [Oscillospiraceae bacterium]
MVKKPTGTPAGAEQLKNDLKAKTPGRFYVLYGEEDYLRRYYLEQLKKLLLDDLTADFNFHRLTSENYTVDLLADCVEALPMMAEHTMILAEDVDLFDGTDAERLCALLSDLPDYCTLVLTYEEFKPDKRKRKLWETIEKNAVLAEFKYQSESDLRAWIRRHFAHEKKNISPELCGYLLQQCGLSMTRLDTEIGKICAYSGAEMIVRADVDAVVEPTLDAVVFQLTDALAARRFDDALERLHALLKMQNDAIPIVAAIGSQMRRLYAAKILLNEGKSAEELAQLCAMPSFAATKTMGQARRLSERFCRKAVLLCCETDYQLKTSYGEEERLVELLILQLAEETRHD